MAKPFAMHVALLCGHFAGGAGLRKEPCPYAKEFASSVKAGGARPLLPEGHRRLEDGLLNEGKGCWGRCDRTAGDCSYCGTGQCCRAIDYRNRVPGCELAEDVKGARCGAWKGEFPDVMNIGLSCFGACGKEPGDCDFCGIAGQCCRPLDGERCVPGCELASTDAWLEGGPGSQCGEFRDPNAAHCTGATPPPATPRPTTGPTSGPTASPPTAAGLLNEGRGCWGRCDRTAGDCAFCGTGQCCRAIDYRNQVPGCERAEDVVGAKCGAWRGEFPDVMNVGLSCFGACGNEPGDCDFCGIAGQCCRRFDGQRCAPGCELASTDAWLEGGPGSQCGAFSDPDATYCTGVPPPPAPTTPAPAGSGPTASPPTTSEGGLGCGGRDQCDISGGNPPGDCAFCGTGQCCNDNAWWRGVPGCELAENAGKRYICGAFSQPHPEPYDFRIGAPRGVHPTPPDQPTDPMGGLWIKDIVADGSNPADHALPSYDGDGGQPWSKFEMALVRDLLLFQMRLASGGRDELSASKFIRLPFHDCLLYSDGTGGCDGCINWDNVGFRYEGRVEGRNFEDHERTSSNNGIGDAVRFLEHIFTTDLGKTWASGCYLKPGTVSCRDCDLANTGREPIRVSSVEECRDRCLNTPGCQYFTVPHMRILDSHGPCRLFSDRGNFRTLTGKGRQIAGNTHCPAESWSLRSRGKSRADLWAFASLVAVEEGIQRHNWACDGDRRSPHNGPIMCTQFEGEDQCKITLRRPFVFKTGRKDCGDGASYTTEKKEDLPDEHFNGTMTVRFMEDHYGFSAKETVTIMGAHTVGTFHQRQTGHKYRWTTDFQAFNNQFYRNIAGKEDWFFDDDECTRVGDAWGNKGHAVWIAKMNQVFRSGGPIQWIQKKVVCPNCAARSYERGGRHPNRLGKDRSCCLDDVPEGAQCRPDNWDPSMTSMIGTKATERDDDFSDGCEYSHFIFGKDEGALGSDMGLMYKFDVDIRGFPSGCPGLHTFYPSAKRFSDYTCGIDGRPWFENPALSWDDPNLERVTRNEWTDVGCPADCGRQDYQYPGDTLTLADHVERYADDQDLWIQEFVPVMEKMIANGYKEDDLVVSFSGESSENPFEIRDGK